MDEPGELIALLREAGIDENLKNKENLTALEVAMKEKSELAVKLLKGQEL
jgi:ankyrin repeat protein